MQKTKKQKTAEYNKKYMANLPKEKLSEYRKRYWEKNKDSLKKRRADYLSKYTKTVRAKYLKTAHGVIQTIVHSQRSSSKKRGQELPVWSVDEFYTYALADSSFCKLYSEWVKSGHNRDLKPSVDRIDCLLPYTWDNIQFMTAYENKHIKGVKEKFRLRELGLTTWGVKG